MSKPNHRTDRLARLSDAIGVPRPEGRAGTAIQWLTVWFLGNTGWIVGGLVTSFHVPGFRPPPGWPYWSLWCGGGSLIAAAVTMAVSRIRVEKRHCWLWFLGISLVMCMLEETLCYLTGTGMWEGRTRFWPEFAVGVTVLMGWTIGVAMVLRFSGLEVWEALILCGFSGWIAEAFIVPRFIHAPLLLIWIIPLTIVSYLLLILPGLAVVGPSLSIRLVDPQRGVRPYLAALLAPAACWLGAAVLIGIVTKL